MASKTQRKPDKRNARKPARVAVAPGKKKVSARKGSKAARPVKKAAPKKAPAKKVAARKAAPKKAVKKAAPKKIAPSKSAKAAPKKAAIKKAAPKKAPPLKPVKKALPPAKAATKKAPAKAAPAKAAPPVKAVPTKAAPAKKAAPGAEALAPVKGTKPEKVQKGARKAIREAAPTAAIHKGAARAVPPPVAAEGVEPDLEAEPGELPEDAAAWADAEALIAPVLPPAPRKRGRKRRDPLDDLLSPEKPKRGRPGRPRKRSPLMEVIPPKRARLRKRLRARRSGEGEDFDLPVAPRPPAPRDTMTVEQIRADVLARYLRGETPSCPVGCGGLAQVVRISTAENGAGEVWLECLSCAQRERFEVPAPTAEEREAVYATLEAGNEPLCPRHSGRWVQFRRRGRDLVCPECGILIPGR